ncbi:MAG: methylmalonyl-CoA mutase [FCB group bacterium]|nr:methylmalonyl-CoA mutase [FCB group bacterium]
MSKKDSKEEIIDRMNSWEGDYKKTVARSPERFDNFSLSGGTPIKPLYTPLDMETNDFLNDISFPGQYPYTRGVYAAGYRTQLWNIQQVSGYALADDTNKRLKQLKAQGQAGVYGKDTVNAVFDLPTHYGYDSDMPEAEGEVGRLGVAIDSLADMEMMFDGFRPDNTFVSFIINHPAMILLSMYLAHAEKQGVPPEGLMGVMQNDPLSTFTGSKSFIFPPRPSMKLISDIFAYSTKKLPKWNLNGIVGYHFREAGGTAVQEMAFAIANAMAYIEAGTRVGLEVDEFVPRFSFFFSVHNNFFEEVAKLRAARRFWARMLKEKYKSQNPRAQLMRFHLQTGGSTLTAKQPDNNIVRVAVQAMAAIMAGAQGLHTNSKDEALSLPTEEAVTLALRTQQILAHESGLTETVDPLGGSYYLESLTDQIEADIEGYIKQIAGYGENMLEAVINGLEQGFFHKELADAAYRHHLEVTNKARIVVGVNKFEDEQEKINPTIFKADPTARDRQKERLKKIKSERNNSELQAALKELAGAIKRDENLFPYILKAVKEYGTLGEIVGLMTDVYGHYQDLSIV